MRPPRVLCSSLRSTSSSALPPLRCWPLSVFIRADRGEKRRGTTVALRLASNTRQGRLLSGRRADLFMTNKPNRTSSECALTSPSVAVPSRLADPDEACDSSAPLSQAASAHRAERNSGEVATLPAGPNGSDRSPLFHGVFLGGFECSCQRLESGRRLDMLRSTRHDEFAQADYERLRNIGMTACREGVSWVDAAQTAGSFDFS